MVHLIKKWVIVKFITIFIIFIPIPLILSGVYIYRNEVNTLITNNTNKNLQLTEQIAKKIDDNILRFILTASSITNENSTYNGPQSIIDRVNILRTLTNETDQIYSDEESGTQMKLILPAITRDIITSAEGDPNV